jgi:glycosyltransferase involved in cell wall biosynthesis
MSRHAPSGRDRRVAILRHSDTLDPQLRREAESLRDAGFDVDVIMLGSDRISADEHVDGVRVRRVPMRRKRGAGNLRYILDYVLFTAVGGGYLTALHLRRRYRVVQVNSMPDFLAFGALVPKLTGARLAVFMKEPMPELFEANGREGLTRLVERSEQLTIRFADEVLTVTDELKQTFVDRGADGAKITVVLNASSISSVPPETEPRYADPERFTVMCHGLVAERYGIDTIVDAAAKAREEVPGLRVWIAGDGPYADDVRRRIDERGVGDVVEFLGFLPVSDLLDRLASADAGIVAQKASSYSHLVHTTKMYEYFAFGKPVIASRLHSVTRLFGPESLELYDAGDPADLASAIVRLAQDPDRRAALAAAASTASASHGWDRQREVYLDVMNRMAARAR